MSLVAVTGTVIWPNGDDTTARSPSADLSSAASSTCISACCTRSPRISSGELCIHEFSERGSRMPIIRSG